MIKEWDFKEWRVSFLLKTDGKISIKASRSKKSDIANIVRKKDGKELSPFNGRTNYVLQWDLHSFASSQDLTDILQKNKALFRFICENLQIPPEKIKSMIPR